MGQKSSDHPDVFASVNWLPPPPDVEPDGAAMINFYNKATGARYVCGVDPSDGKPSRSAVQGSPVS